MRPSRIAGVEKAIASVEETFPIAGYTAQNLEAYRTLADVALRYLSPGMRILDIGSGPCDKIAVLRELGFACTAVDDLNDPWHKEGDVVHEIQEFARGHGVDFRIAEAAAINFEPASFDMVMVCDVIEHLHSSPREMLLRAVNLIRPSGVLVITVPNAVNLRKRLAVVAGRTNLPPFDSYYWWKGEWRGHVREYVRNDLEELAGYLDLETLELRGVNHMLGRLPGILRQPFARLTRFAQSLRDSWIFVGRRPTHWELSHCSRLGADTRAG